MYRTGLDSNIVAFLKDAAERPDDIGRHMFLASGMEDTYSSVADKSVCRVLSNEMFLKTAFGPAWAEKAAAALEQFHSRMESRSRESMDREVQKFLLSWLLQHFSPSMSGRSNEGLDFQLSASSDGKGGNDDSALMTEGDNQVFGSGGKGGNNDSAIMTENDSQVLGEGSKDNGGRDSSRSQDNQSGTGFRYGSCGKGGNDDSAPMTDSDSQGSEEGKDNDGRETGRGQDNQSGTGFRSGSCGKGGNDDSAPMTDSDSQGSEEGKDNDGRDSSRSQNQQSGPGLGYGSEGQRPFTIKQQHIPSMLGRSNEGLDFQLSASSDGKEGNDDSALMTEGDNQGSEEGKDNGGRDSSRSQDNQSGPGFGYGGEGQTPFSIKQQDIFLNSIPYSLYKLAKKIGRAGDNFEKPKGRFSTASKCDINGITTGDNLSALLPSEVALLGDARTQDIFYSRYAGKKLQVFSSASSGTMVTRKHQDGPVIMCVDMSGSMKGEPIDIARTMALAVTIIAQREKRDVLLIKYSDNQKMMKIDCIGRQRREVERFLSLVALGGNNENRMFRWLFSEVIPSLPSFKTADVLCVSDFGWCPLDRQIIELIEQHKASGMKFYGLNIGSDFGLFNMDEELSVFAAARGYGGDPMSVLDEVWVYDNGECIQRR